AQLTLPYAFPVPCGTPLGPGAFMVSNADMHYSGEGVHLGCTLDADGDSLVLFDQNVKLVDSIQFGRRIAGYSIGRVADGSWVLCDLPFGAKNVAAMIDDPKQLRINESLTDRQFAASESVIELYTPSTKAI